MLGVPNAALGLVVYVFIAIGLWRSWAAGLLLAGASAALGLSVYLAFYLLANRLECRICWVGHGANLVIWLALVARLA